LEVNQKTPTTSATRRAFCVRCGVYVDAEGPECPRCHFDTLVEVPSKCGAIDCPEPLEHPALPFCNGHLRRVQLTRAWMKS